MNLKESRFFMNNLVVFIYIFFFVFLEMTAQFFLGANPYIVNFWMPLLILTMVTCFLLCWRSVKVKNILAIVLVVIQIALIITGNILYNSNGTAFQKEMLSQRNDALGTLEEIPVSKSLVIICAVALIIFITVSILHIKKHKHTPVLARKKIKYISFCLCMIACFIFIATPVASAMSDNAQKDYHYLLYARQGDANQMYGVSTNFMYEMIKLAVSNGVNTEELSMVEDFIYEELCDTSIYNGISSDNNLIMILAESFDYHVLERYSDEENAILFPTITKLINKGIIATNFRQKEKTDTSEMISMLGNYPTKNYIHYDFPENSYPFSLPNVLGGYMGETAQINYFHPNELVFYNRGEVLPSIGFKEVYGIDEMLPYGMIDTWHCAEKNGASSEMRNLDSNTIKYMKDVMFPAEQKFFTYWTTFTMHGYYKYERKNLTHFYEKLDEYGLFPEGSDKEDQWRTYAVAVMDFDYALEMMMKDLEQKQILDKTTIAIVADHETYYNNLSRYAKSEKLNGDYDTELYRIPMIIYDEKLSAAMDAAGEERVIKKFTTTSDVVPTILDLFGVPAWKNMYLGSSIFNDEEESIVYSRVYKYFFNDKLLFYNANSLLFKAEDYTQDDYDLFIERATKHLDKLFIIDKIYFSDYFGKNEYRCAE